MSVETTGDSVMATASLTVIDSRPAAQTEIENYLSTRELVGIEEDIAKVGPDLAHQIVAQAVGKPKLDPDAVVAPFKAAKTKHDQLQEKKAAIEFLLDALAKRLEQLKSQSPSDFVIVLNQHIAATEQQATKTQDEANRVAAELEQLKKELKEIVDAHPDAAPGAAGAYSAETTSTASASASTTRSNPKAR
jgi:chromosome segregation ATPase